VSGQLVVRSQDGALRRWPNWREVPLGLVVTPLGSERPVEVAAKRH
jgi:hypothetical protein